MEEQLKQLTGHLEEREKKKPSPISLKKVK